jgi:hypothetical protein
LATNTSARELPPFSRTRRLTHLGCMTAMLFAASSSHRPSYLVAQLLIKATTRASKWPFQHYHAASHNQR